MEQEAFFSGYCRALDSSRTVCAVKENSTLTEADCDFPACPYINDCTVAKSIRAWIEE